MLNNGRKSNMTTKNQQTHTTFPLFLVENELMQNTGSIMFWLLC